MHWALTRFNSVSEVYSMEEYCLCCLKYTDHACGEIWPWWVFLGIHHSRQVLCYLINCLLLAPQCTSPKNLLTSSSGRSAFYFTTNKNTIYQNAVKILQLPVTQHSIFFSKLLKSSKLLWKSAFILHRYIQNWKLVVGLARVDLNS